MHVDDVASSPCDLRYCSDGTMLAVASSNGCAAVYLARLPTTCAVCGTTIAALSSLDEISIWDTATEQRIVCKLLLIINK